MIVLGCDSFAEAVAHSLGVKSLRFERRTFPDWEQCPRILGEVEDHVVLINRMKSEEFNTNSYLMETLLLTRTLRDMGATKIELVMPYLVYSRQDRVFRHGEPYSSRTVLDLLRDAGATKIITISLHSTKDIDRPDSIPVANLDGFAPIVERIKQLNLKNPIITGPDLGVTKATKLVASALGCDAVVLKKTRDHATGEIKITGDIPTQNKDIVIVDDIISTGWTMSEAIKICKKAHARTISAFAVHGLFTTPTYIQLRRATNNFAVTDTIQTPVSSIPSSSVIINHFRS
ncbi:MAG: ribose-phosphate diphosphokinase [Nanoarchaeota archaeon]|nr:ribose-phosphate diphosphokinase [Nanoarchaeota archaeon]